MNILPVAIFDKPQVGAKRSTTRVQIKGKGPVPDKTLIKQSGFL